MKAFPLAPAAIDIKRVAVLALSLLAMDSAASAQVVIGPAPVGSATSSGGTGSTAAGTTDDSDIDPNTGLKKSFEQRHAPPRQKFNPLLAPQAPPKPSEDAVIPPPDISKIKQGYGWCRAVDGIKRAAYYTTLIPGNPNIETKSRHTAFRLYLKDFYPNISEFEDKDIYCYWSQFSADYVVMEFEKEDAYSHILQNYDVKMTPWHP